MDQKSKSTLLGTFESFDNEDDRLDERFYEFIDKETLDEFLSLVERY